MWRDLKVAYQSWLSLVFILLNAVALFNFVTRALELELSELIGQLLGAYRLIFHPIINILLAPFPIALSDLQKDLILVWLAIGAATSRTFFREFAMNAKIGKDPDSIRRSDYWDSLWWGLSSFIVWPIAWVILFRRPYFYSHHRRDGRTLFLGRWHENPADSAHAILADMRVVLAVQVLTVVAVVLVLTAINYIGLR